MYRNIALVPRVQVQAGFQAFAETPELGAQRVEYGIYPVKLGIYPVESGI